jgi:hypothetical protein
VSLLEGGYSQEALSQGVSRHVGALAGLPDADTVFKAKKTKAAQRMADVDLAGFQSAVAVAPQAMTTRSGAAAAQAKGAALTTAPSTPQATKTEAAPWTPVGPPSARQVPSTLPVSRTQPAAPAATGPSATPSASRTGTTTGPRVRIKPRQSLDARATAPAAAAPVPAAPVSAPAAPRVPATPALELDAVAEALTAASLKDTEVPPPRKEEEGALV